MDLLLELLLEPLLPLLLVLLLLLLLYVFATTMTTLAQVNWLQPVLPGHLGLNWQRILVPNKAAKDATNVHNAC